MKPDRNRPVSVEDLLRLKRAERPPSEFWAEFDRELRAKQLSALVAKRPWWQSLPAVSLKAFARLRLPLAAAAVCSLTFLVVRDNRAPANAKPAPMSPIPATARALPAADFRNGARESAIASLADLPSGAVPTESAGAVITANPIFDQSNQVAATAESPAADVPTVTSPTSVAEATGARLPVSLVTTTAVPSPGSRLLGGKTGFESRGLPARSTVEPLAQMAPPGESRRTRLLTAMVSSASLETSARTTERAVSRIAEDRLYDQVQRFGARGDRLNVKF